MKKTINRQMRLMTVEEVQAVCDGMIFTLREYPVVYGGSLLARILQPAAGGAAE